MSRSDVSSNMFPTLWDEHTLKGTCVGNESNLQMIQCHIPCAICGYVPSHGQCVTYFTATSVMDFQGASLIVIKNYNLLCIQQKRITWTALLCSCYRHTMRCGWCLPFKVMVWVSFQQYSFTQITYKMEVFKYVCRQTSQEQSILWCLCINHLSTALYTCMTVCVGQIKSTKLMVEYVVSRDEMRHAFIKTHT